jgi:hypothetical protein
MTPESITLTPDRRRALAADLADLVAQIVPRKRALRSPWPGPMAETQRAVHALAAAITERLVLLALSRGRRHLSSAPRWMRDAGLEADLEAYQARVAARVAAGYATVPPTARLAP